MGERDLGPAAVGSPRRAPAAFIAPLVLLVVLTLLGVMRPLEPPSSAVGVSHCLGAASLAKDLDLRFEPADAERYRDFVVTRPTDVLLGAHREAEAASFPGNPLAMAWVAPFVLVGGLRGALFAHALALALAMGLAAQTLRQRLDTPWRVLLVCLFGSVVIVFLMEPRPEILVLSAVVAAFALAFRGQVPRFEELSEVYDDPSTRRMSFTLRWLVVGGLLAFVVASHPVYLLLLLPLVAAMPARSRSAAAALAIGAAAVVGLSLATVALFDGVLPWATPLARFDASSGFPGISAVWSAGASVPSLLESARLVPDLSLVGWNLLFVSVGRSIGALPYFLPALLLLALWEPRAGRSALVGSAALIAVVVPVVWPFDYAGDAAGLGNAVLLPVFGALWLVPTRRCSVGSALAVVAAAGLVLWPSWMRSTGLSSGYAAPGATLSPIAQRWLPYETTRRPSGGDYSAQGTVRVLPAGGGLSEKGGRLFLAGERWGSLVLASPRALSTVRLSFDGQAGSELDVAGARPGDTLFAADGGVAFDLALGEATRRHPMWWSDQPQSLYDLRLRLPKAPPVPVAFRITIEP